MQYTLILLLFASDLWTVEPTGPEPRVIFRFLVDYSVVDMSKGAPASAKMLSIQYKLADNSAQLFPDLKGQLIQVSCWVSVARGGRRLATTMWDLSEELPLAVVQATPGDRLLVEMKSIKIRQKDGDWVVLSERVMPVYTIPLY